MKQMGEKLVRKLIPLFIIIGSVAGITAAAMRLSGAPHSFMTTATYFLVYVIAGTLIGFFAVQFFDNRVGKPLVNRNEKGELLLIKQPVYALVVLAIATAFITNYGFGVATAIVGAVFYGLGFILGLANGIFDYRESISKNLLYFAMLPIGLTFVYAYYMSKSDAAMDMAWLFGSTFLFGYLLIVNRMKLNSIIFFQKSVNIEDSRKIRMFNDMLIVIFYALYLVMFNFRKLINFSYDILLKIFTWMLMVMTAIMEWLLADTGEANRDELSEPEKLERLEDVERPWLEVLMKIIIYIVMGVIAIVAVIALVVGIIKIIKKIREKLSEGFNRSMSEKKIKSKEYEEESEIVKDEKSKLSLKRKIRKYQYNLKNLKDIPMGSDKIRYVYGFILERLYHKQVDIAQSDTPEEIIEKIKKHKNGDKLIKMGFDEFSEKYEHARYSGRETDAGDDLEKKGEAFEKSVSDIKVEYKGKY